jgi:hypothetical protein
MKLLAHLLAADARRFRLAIALWVLVAAATVAMQHWAVLLPIGTPGADAIGMASWLVWLSGLLLSCALVPLVIQLHPAVGSAAFWMTRPIAPRLMVLSKLVTVVVLFIMVPVLVEQIQMAVQRMPVGDMARVALQTALLRGLLLAALTVAAVLTPSLGRFALLCGGVLFAFAMLPVVVMLLEAWWPPRESYEFAALVAGASSFVIPWPPTDYTASMVAMTVLAIGGAVGAAVQYERRRVRDSLIVVAAVLAVAIGAATWWPVSFLRASAPTPEWAAHASAAQFSVDSGATRLERPAGWFLEQPRWIARIPARMSAAPAGWLATPRIVRGELSVDGGAQFSSGSAGDLSSLPDFDGRNPIDTSLQAVLNVRRLSPGGEMEVRPEPSGIVLHLPAGAVSEKERRSGMFTGDVRVDITKVDVAGTVALKRGAAHQEGAYRLVVDDVREMGSGILLRTRETAVATLLDRRPRPMYSLFLRNAARSEAVRGPGHYGAVSHSGFPLFSGVSVSMAGPGGFSYRAQDVFFDGRTKPNAASPLDRQWLSEAELVIVRATYNGSIPRTLEIREFPLTVNPDK